MAKWSTFMGTNTESTKGNAFSQWTARQKDNIEDAEFVDLGPPTEEELKAIEWSYKVHGAPLKR